MEAHAKLLLDLSSLIMFSVAEVSFLWPSGSSYFLFASARFRESLNLTGLRYEKQRFVFHPWPHPRSSKPFKMFKQFCVLVHAWHCIVRTLPTTNMSVLRAMLDYLIRRDFASLSMNGTPQMFLTVQVSSNKISSLEDNICIIQSCMQTVYLQFAREGRWCPLLVSSAATAFIWYNYFSIHWPFSLLLCYA